MCKHRLTTAYQLLFLAVQVREAEKKLLEGSRSIDRCAVGSGKLDNLLVAPRENCGIFIVDGNNWGRSGFVDRSCNEQDGQQSSLVGLGSQSQLELRHIAAIPRTDSSRKRMTLKAIIGGALMA